MISARSRAASGAPSASADVPPLRFGLIGCGGMGVGDARQASRFGEVAAVCDVDLARIERAKERFPEADAYTDFRAVLDREDIDAIVCGTVDHWHTLVSIGAMRAGKDIYCEKPLTLTIDEGKHLVRVQRETGRILQTGTQQRSNARFRLAVEAVRNGRLGKLLSVDVWLPAGLRDGPFETSTVPKGFNYDFWLGSTPDVPYVKERTHFSFRYWWEYSGGTMTDWGAHHNDIVLWALDQDRSGPVRIEGRQLADMIPGGFTAPSDYEVAYTYPNGVVHTCRSTRASAWHGGVIEAQQQLHGIMFRGLDGALWVTRGTIEATDDAIINDPFSDDDERVTCSDDHMGNFVESIRTRKPPICDAETGHRSASVAHLGVTAIRLGRELEWDPVAETFVDDAEANTYLAREMRPPCDYRMV